MSLLTLLIQAEKKIKPPYFNTKPKKIKELVTNFDIISIIDGDTIEMRLQNLYNIFTPTKVINILLSYYEAYSCGRARELYNMIETKSIVQWIKNIYLIQEDAYKHMALGATWIRGVCRVVFREIIVSNDTAKTIYNNLSQLCIAENAYHRDSEKYKKSCTRSEEKYNNNKENFLKNFSPEDICPSLEVLFEKAEKKGIDINKNTKENNYIWIKYLVQKSLSTNTSVNTAADFLKYVEEPLDFFGLVEINKEKKSPNPKKKRKRPKRAKTPPRRKKTLPLKF
ncbi:MAG: hypothetical protein CMF41_04115 [Legionellales bacterium]|nr:hypothetical protein [Legionellales bacterium]|tara:strand:+ start:2217 stop:3062 length:846 start_codon:yes stop_codon:yes gene_type:complete